MALFQTRIVGRINFYTEFKYMVTTGFVKVICIGGGDGQAGERWGIPHGVRVENSTRYF